MTSIDIPKIIVWRDELSFSNVYPFLKSFFFFKFLFIFVFLFFFTSLLAAPFLSGHISSPHPQHQAVQCFSFLGLQFDHFASALIYGMNLSVRQRSRKSVRGLARYNSSCDLARTRERATGLPFFLCRMVPYPVFLLNERTNDNGENKIWFIGQMPVS